MFNYLTENNLVDKVKIIDRTNRFLGKAPFGYKNITIKKCGLIKKTGV